MTNKCTQCGAEFTFDVSFEGFKYDFDAPEICGECRQKTRLIWRNERVLHKRKCDATGRDIVSVFTPDAPFPVYDADYWHSDKWEAMDYGRDFDFNRPFFEQFKELMHSVPQLSRSVLSNVNCDYVNQCGWCKNCYLIFEADGDENCMYSNNIYDSRSSMDMSMCFDCELGYECIDCRKCYNLRFSQNCENCSDSWFLKNCIGCKSCYGCVNLRNKEYYFLNEKYSKEEYEKKVAAVKLTTYEALRKARSNFLEFAKKYPHKYLHGSQNEDSTGNYIFNTQRCKDCYDLMESQDCSNVYNCRHMKQCHDITVFGSVNGATYSYYCHEVGDGAKNVFFSDQVWKGSYDIAYSKLCVNNSHDLFGCVGLSKKQYCIFNKQYSESEYKDLLNKIIEHMKSTGEWGKFFPKEMSPFAYNETILNDYYPLTEQEAKEKGYRWVDISFQTDVKGEGISNCLDCKKSFKIVPGEMDFYERQKLPVPGRCHDCRHMERFKLRNPRVLVDRKCDKCGLEVLSTYSVDRPEKVYCEKCYLESVD